MNKIKRNDTVVVLTGKDRGRSGRVIAVIDNKRAVVEGVNMVKKHIRPNPQKQTQGGIVARESSIALSNIALLNPATNKPDAVGFKTLEAKDAGQKPKKVRYFKSNNELVDAV